MGLTFFVYVINCLNTFSVISISLFSLELVVYLRFSFFFFPDKNNIKYVAYFNKPNFFCALILSLYYRGFIFQYKLCNPHI